ncbi:MAG: DUF1501 domain-containing protein [Gemmatimonadales bacterium]
MSRTISRRVFVRAGALALVSFGLDPLFLDRAAYAITAGSAPGTRGKVLLCLFQRGAVDGLSMIVPHGDTAYYRVRPRIAVPASEVLDLDGYFGLHPALAPLKPWWDNRSLALVHAAGSPAATRSHFEAQDYMETGTPGTRSTTDGWVNRFCQHDREHADTPFKAVAFGSQLPRMLAGSAPSLAIGDLRSFGFRTGTRRVADRITRAFEALYQGSSTGLLASSSAEGFEAIQMLRSADPTRYAPDHGAEYPRGRFGESLLQVAQLIKAGLGLQVAVVDVSGWDTHVGQGAGEGQLANRLGELGQGLAAFARDLGERMSDVVVLTMSEFGRTVAENGTGGTDHGHGTAMMVMGGGVRGGRVAGRWPGLGADSLYQGRDLAVTTDFRDLFGEVLVRHFGGADLAAVFPDHTSGPQTWPGVMEAG